MCMVFFAVKIFPINLMPRMADFWLLISVTFSRVRMALVSLDAARIPSLYIIGRAITPEFPSFSSHCKLDYARTDQRLKAHKNFPNSSDDHQDASVEVTMGRFNFWKFQILFPSANEILISKAVCFDSREPSTKLSRCYGIYPTCCPI